jgi:hypothetical protein
LAVTPRRLSDEEREELGRTAHRNWIAVRKQQHAAGLAVNEDELRPWSDLPDEDKELFRRSGESLALPDEIFLEALKQQRKLMGEKAFRKKMFEIRLSVAIEKMMPEWSEAERYRAIDIVLKLSEMLDVPPSSGSPS